MSNRRNKRKNKPNSKDIIPLRQRKVLKSRMNKGGFYEGMPGVTLDKHGNRILSNIIITPEGEAHLQLFGPPKLIKLAVQDQMSRNPMTRAIFRGAVVDDLFTWKNPLDWPLKIRYNIWLYFKARKYQKKQKEEMKKKLSINKKDGQ